MAGNGHRHDWYVFNTITLGCGCVIVQEACRAGDAASRSSTNACATHR